MKNIRNFILLVFMAVSLAACSDSDDYNADTAPSFYKPASGRRMVAQVKTTNIIGGRDYSWEHNFSYDAQGRIKQIDSKMVHHRAVQFDNSVRYYKCYITSQANYYYDNDKLRVDYTLSREYPDYQSWNTTESEKDRGVFDDNGTLTRMAAMYLEYSGTQLQRADTSDGLIVMPWRDNRGNVTGYVKYLAMHADNDSVLLDRRNDVKYSSIKNKTNFDFSGYFGYWGVEQATYANRTEYYASYQLAAFGMLGATSPNLPFAIVERDSNGNVVIENGSPKYLYGEWEFDSQDCPVSYTDGTGRRTEIKYVE